MRPLSDSDVVTGPIDATRRLLDRTALAIDDFDTIEINEAFEDRKTWILQLIKCAVYIPNYPSVRTVIKSHHA